jgi:hypothetical protein
MKKKYINLILIIAAFSFSGCYELDIENPNRQDEDTFWTTEQNLFQGLVAAYDMLNAGGLYWESIPMIHTGMSDEGTNNAPYEFNALVRFQQEDLNAFQSIWFENYAMIGRAYAVIENAGNIATEDAYEYAAEAKFLVALAYFHLTHYYGPNIAYVTGVQTPADRPERAEDGELYELMAELLAEAIPNLPLASERSSDEYGRITKGAAKALLAKVHLAKGYLSKNTREPDYASAEILLKEIVNSGEYALLESFHYNFDEVIRPAKFNPESLFHVNWQFDSPYGEAGKHQWRFRLFSLGEARGAFGDLQATDYSLTEFRKEKTADDEDDPRLEWSLFFEGTSQTYYCEDHDFWVEVAWDPESTNAFYKYSEQGRAEGSGACEVDWYDGGTDFIVIRYADVLLLLAEVLNQNGQTSEAYQYVDLVRERAGMPTLTSVNPGLSQEAFFEQIKHERYVELFSEYVRFYDIKRWGMYGPELADYDPDFKTFTIGQDEYAAIPQSELDKNENLVQNPGY